MPSTRILLAVVALAAPLPGCQPNPLFRQALSGTVQFDSQPLADGSITFQPTEGQATSGGAPIMNGHFAVPSEKGLAPGKYRVIIHAPAPGTGGKAEGGVLPGEAPTPPAERIPAEWNTASNQTIDVKKSGTNSFSFIISTKPANSKTN